jgi:hypothetical protein
MLIFLCATASPAVAGEFCRGVAVRVSAPSEAEERFACAAARDALQMLRRCDVFLHRPLHVHVLAEVRHPAGGPIFGLFDMRQERVLVTRYANTPGLIEGTPYSELPLIDFYRSLIIHEVVHGALHQNYKRPPYTQAAYEYPAYALQIEALPADLREKFLQSSTPPGSAGKGFQFNDTILLFDPFFFGARAYQHFKAAGDGCAVIHRLLAGEVDFIAAR